MKANTTRSNARAIMTQGDTQIVFLDTPGVVDSKAVSKYKLDNNLIMDPERSCYDADLLIVLHDVSNRYVREAINKKVLRLLALYYRDVPSILVLNKMDTIPRSRRVYDLIRKLTCNRLDGVQGQVSISKHDSKRSMETYLKRKAREMDVHDSNTNDGETFGDILKTASSETPLTEHQVYSLH